MEKQVVDHLLPEQQPPHKRRGKFGKELASGAIKALPSIPVTPGDFQRVRLFLMDDSLRSDIPGPQSLAQLEPTIETESLSSRPETALEITRAGLDAMEVILKTTMNTLSGHKIVLERHIQDQIPASYMSEEAAQEVRRLQTTESSIRQCSRQTADVDSITSEMERLAVFEVSILAEDSDRLVISSIDDLIAPGRIDLPVHATAQLIGLMTDEELIRLSGGRYGSRFNTIESE